MSLEQALADNTAAMKELTAMWATLNRQAKRIDERVATGGTTGIRMADEKRVEVEAPKPAPIQPVAEVAQPAPAEAAKASPSEISYEVVSKAITEKAKTDRAGVVALLAKFGAKKGTELKPEQYADFMKEVA